MLNGERPNMCAGCFKEEDSMINNSPRFNMNERYMFKYERSETPEFKIKYIDLRLGNKCNLKCRMCNPYSSNQWVKEWQELSDSISSPYINKLTKEEKNYIKRLDWPSQIKFNNLIENLNFLEEIYLTGGEPLLIEEQYLLLDECIKGGFSKQITLKYNTNLTKIPTKIIEYWRNFKEIELNVSIDGFMKLNNYIRHPSKWEQIEKNLKYIKSLKKEEGLSIKITIHSTIQMYNILSLQSLLSWVEKQKIDIFFNILDEPKFLNIRTLPKPLKNKVEQDLSKQKNIPVEKIIKYMNAEDWPQYLTQFFIHSDILDKSRKENLNNFFPELNTYR